MTYSFRHHVHRCRHHLTRFAFWRQLQEIRQSLDAVHDGCQHLRQELASSKEILADLHMRFLNMTKTSIAQQQTLEDLKAQVARNTEVTSSAKTLIEGLAAKVATLASHPPEDIQAQITALADELRTASDSLAESVVKSTPAEH